MKKKNRVALLMLGVSSTACGGAERFFADFFREYQLAADTDHELFFFTDPGTESVLKQLGKLAGTDNVVVLKNVSNRFKRFVETRNFLRQLRRHKIDLIHVTNYNTNYFDRLKHVAGMSASDRPKIAANIVDCEIPYILEDTTSPRNAAYRKRYMPLFGDIKPDGVFTWYELFCRFARASGLMPENSLVEAAQTRFADTSGFTPASEKQKEIVFAARLTEQKKPLLFLEAIRLVQTQRPELLSGWKVSVYGSGALEGQVSGFIDTNNLKNMVTCYGSRDLKPVLAASSCFVSTQDYENFPSLSMNEAMAAGNVIISRNVGQTALFVEDGKNGFLAETDDAIGVAGALIRFLDAPEKHTELMKHSVYLAREVHTPANFIRQIDRFWKNVMKS